MAWKSMDVQEQRMRFVVAALRRERTLSSLCQEFEISRPTGRLWLERYRVGGVLAIAERSRRPRHSPRQTAPELEQRVVQLRLRYPDWGARKLQVLLGEDGTHLPASTIHRILLRHQLVQEEDRHRAATRRFQFSRYSLGMKQRLGIAAALLADPLLLILDEPTNGLDPAGIVEMRSLIRSLADEGMTLFVSSHLLSEIEHICDHVVMIRSGRSVFQGSVAELRDLRSAELVLRPEDPRQLGLLAQLLSDRSLKVEIEEATSSVVVAGGSAMAGELNRAAFEAGVTISHLAERERSLEEAYFALTGTHSGDVEDSGALGVVR
jgi:ABC-type arginine transport system ATPase subunit